MGTIINLAQDFVGSNNINLLQPIGQFGTRLAVGNDGTSPHYIFTQMSTLAKIIFNPKDEPLLDQLFEDNQNIEPIWYMPIIPLILVNGAHGMGTGWKAKIQNYEPQTIVQNLLQMMGDDGGKSVLLIPSFKKFKGTISPIFEHGHVVYSGILSVISETEIEITELPIRTWTQSYKTLVLEEMVKEKEIQSYKEQHTDTTVRFVVTMLQEKLTEEKDKNNLHEFFKLNKIDPLASSMNLFYQYGHLRKYENAEEILKYCFDLQLAYYK